ncbi:diguanylate cyclase/phosphodiesterase with PAS/PAC sensor(s) [Thalassoporum mexicanum PCC 7367]|uniref:EAL domain-containing protein n=1 Tax=Thalassoporum mexicanum TaxID=3457544 RepID=UPI00029F9723|nr:EAL domain-containing protein [Pseudanabaena sp. PCC 7367]AFY69116.1 diguanylate cyclase/phosphodiesterase with PAS/PAC sensor(s) [Pseudanabaena sp. PCC 7367]
MHTSDPSETELQAILSAMTDLILIYDDRGVCLKIVQNNQDVLVMPIAEQLNKSVFELLPPDVAKLQMRYIQDVLATGHTQNVEYSLMLNGKLTWFSANVSRLTASTVIWVARDITARKISEQALGDARSQLQTLLNAVPGIVSWISSDLSYLGVNRHLAETFDLPIEQFVGKRVGFLGVSPEFAHFIEEFFAKPLQQEHCEVTANLDGRIIHYLVVAQKYDQGRAAFTIGIDVTQQKDAEESLKDKERILQLVLDNIPQHIFWKDTNSVFLGCNRNWAKAAQIGSPEAVIGKTDFDLLDNPAVAEEYRQQDRRIMASGKAELHKVETKQKTAAGEDPTWLDVNKIPIHDSDGQVIGILSTVEDITSRMKSQAALEEAEAKYRNIFENAVEGIFQSTPDREGQYISANPALAKIYGYDCAEDLLVAITSIRDQIYVEPERRDEFINQLQRSGVVYEFKAQVYCRDGTIIWVSENATAVHDAEGKLLYFEGIVEDITERLRAEERIRYQAAHDLLTELPNRKLFNQRLREAIGRAKEGNSLMAVMFLDLDRFKTINSSLGHGAGDQLLQEVAQRLKDSLAPTITLARWGGDEFTLLLPIVASAEDAVAVAEQILNQLKPAFCIESCTIHSSCSIGIAIYPKDGEDGSTLIKNADAAMFSAKEQGRNNSQLYARAMNIDATSLLELESGLHTALEAGEFVLLYQPKVNPEKSTIVGVEALIRWQHPAMGLIMPNVFVPLAEENGFILPLAEWVLYAACKQNKIWQEQGIATMRVAVNISARQFLQPTLVDTVAKILNQTGLEPQYLELEITESLAMQDVYLTRTILDELYDMGVYISIDDFGTGHSSLSSIKNFPVHSLKVDQSFVRDLPEDRHSRAIIASIVALAQGLNLKVVVEGVETEAQLNYLRSLHCEEIQGHLYSKPISAQKLIDLIAASHDHLSFAPKS